MRTFLGPAKGRKQPPSPQFIPQQWRKSAQLIADVRLGSQHGVDDAFDPPQFRIG